MKFYYVSRRREREREKDLKSLRQKKGENKESYKCSFFKHFIVVVVIVLLAAHDQSCLAPSHCVTRNQFLFEKAHIKHTYTHIQLVPTEQSSFYSFLSLVLFCFLSIVTVSYSKEDYDKTL
jgi:hypothetical protein